MSLITWTDDLSVSVSGIDAQHKKLVTMINNLHDAMRERKGNDVIGTILKEMVAYSKTHFNYEEGLLTSAGYKDLASHRQIHANFIKKATGLQNDFESGKMGVTMETMKFLSDWLVNHIKGEDRKYISTLAPKQAAPTA